MLETARTQLFLWSCGGVDTDGSDPRPFFLVLATTVAVAFLVGVAVSTTFLSSGTSTPRAGSKTNKSDCIYLDYNGTTPIDPQVLEAMIPYFTTHFGNPSSAHVYGTSPRQAVVVARTQILRLLVDTPSSLSDKRTKNNNDSSLPLPSSSIWFTSCGTEADNLAIHLALQSTRHWFVNKKNKKPHIITTNIEHPAIAACLDWLEHSQQVCTVTYVPVQRNGCVAAQDIVTAIQKHADRVVLVTLMLANNETGAMQPVREVAKYCRQHGILCHTDAAQAAGKVSLHLESALGGVDLVTLVGHKLGAPKGIACLYVRPNCLDEHSRQSPAGHILLHGGGQEFGRRGGTENVPYIVGMGVAAAQAAHDWPRRARHMRSMKRRLYQHLALALGENRLVVHGPHDDLVRCQEDHKDDHADQDYDCLPNTLYVSIRGVFNVNALLATVGHLVAVSAGASCHSSSATGITTTHISSVLQAMQVPVEVAKGTLRWSIGPSTTRDDIDRAVQYVVQEIKRLDASSSSNSSSLMKDKSHKAEGKPASVVRV